MPTEVLGFSDKTMRDEQWRQWRADGSRGVTRHSAYQDNRTVWVVTRQEPPSVPVLTQPEVVENGEVATPRAE